MLFRDYLIRMKSYRSGHLLRLEILYVVLYIANYFTITSFMFHAVVQRGVLKKWRVILYLFCR